jgi:hypothetical protein
MSSGGDIMVDLWSPLQSQQMLDGDINYLISWINNNTKKQSYYHESQYSYHMAQANYHKQQIDYWNNLSKQTNNVVITPKQPTPTPVPAISVIPPAIPNNIPNQQTQTPTNAALTQQQQQQQPQTTEIEERANRLTGAAARNAQLGKPNASAGNSISLASPLSVGVGGVPFMVNQQLPFAGQPGLNPRTGQPIPVPNLPLSGNDSNSLAPVAASPRASAQFAQLQASMASRINPATLGASPFPPSIQQQQQPVQQSAAPIPQQPTPQQQQQPPALPPTIPSYAQQNKQQQPPNQFNNVELKLIYFPCEIVAIAVPRSIFSK